MANSNKPTSLKRRSEFQQLKRTGSRNFPNSWLILNHSESQKDCLRYGLTLPTYVGNAVLRNRIKRWCREFFNSYSGPLLIIGIDLNIVFRKQKKGFYQSLKHDELYCGLEKGIQKLESAYFSNS